jgi:hypothetical protein
VSLMTYSEARHIEVSAPQGPSRVYSVSQILIATPSSRNHPNSPDISETYRSNRNKRKGPHGLGEGRTGEMRGGAHSMPAQLQISTRNTRGNRNRLKPLFISEINFSTRNKTGGAADLWPRKSRRGGRLGIPRNPSAVAGLLREGGSRISNGKTSGNRNHRNSLKKTDGHRL